MRTQASSSSKTRPLVHKVGTERTRKLDLAEALGMGKVIPM